MDILTPTTPSKSQQRAPQKTAEEWEEAKPIIMKHYHRHTLHELMNIMSNEHAFHGSARQFGYRFKLWNLKKYGVEKNGSDQQQDDAEVHGASQRSSTESMGDDEEGGLVAIDLDGQTTYVSLNTVLFPFTGDDLNKKHAADFLAALSDDIHAFPLYYELYHKVLERVYPLNPIAQVLLNSCVRSAQDPEHISKATKLIKNQRAAGSSQDFRLSMMEEYMQVREGVAQNTNADKRICDLMSRLLAAENSLASLPRPFKAVDLVTWQMLSYGLCKYAEFNRPERSRRGFIQHYQLQYLETQPFSMSLSSKKPLGHSIIKDCLLWIQGKLNHPLAVAITVPNESGQDMHHWKENIELFVNLWHTLFRPPTSGPTLPACFARSDIELGISASELLCTLCWMIQDPNDAPVAIQSASSDSMFRHAQANAKVLSTWSEEKLWHHFLSKFNWMNNLVALKEGEEDFQSRFLISIREHIASALGVKLPFTTLRSQL